MQITVYENFAKENNSTKVPSDELGVIINNVRLKENVSVLAPIFQLQGVDYNITYLKWNNRYYFVNDIVAVSNSIAEYHCNIDTLASWKSFIGDSTQYVLRSSAQHDEYLQDMLYPMKMKCTEEQLSLTQFNDTFNKSTFVVGIINNQNFSASGGAVTYYVMGASDFRDFFNYMFGNAWLEDTEELSEGLQKLLINPAQYVVSCMWFPFSIPRQPSFYEVRFGFWAWENNLYDIVNEEHRYFTYTTSFNLPEHPKASTRGKYLNGAPFTRYMLDCYSFGQIALDPIYLIDHSQTLNIQLKCDIYTGDAEILILTNENELLIRQSGSMGVPIQINQIEGGIKKSLSSAAGGMLSLVDNFSGNVLGLAQGVGNAMTNLMPQFNSSYSIASGVAYTRTPSVTSTFYDIADEDNEHLGRPLCQRKKISTLSGYMVVQDADVDIPCTQSEKEQIISFMEGGFYYE